MIVGIKDIRSAVITSIFIMICFGCADDSTDDSSDNTGSIEYVDLALTNQTEKVSSIEYTKSTAQKCKYLTDSMETFDLTLADGISTHLEGKDKYDPNKFKAINIYFPLLDPKISGSDLTAEIRALSYSNTYKPSVPTPASGTCYTIAVAGVDFKPDYYTDWIDFIVRNKPNCYQAFPAVIHVTITNYKSESCSISFSVS